MRLKTKVQPVDMDKIVKRGVNAVKGVTGIGKKDEPAQQQQPAPTGYPPAGGQNYPTTAAAGNAYPAQGYPAQQQQQQPGYPAQGYQQQQQQVGYPAQGYPAQHQQQQQQQPAGGYVPPPQQQQPTAYAGYSHQAVPQPAHNAAPPAYTQQPTAQQAYPSAATAQAPVAQQPARTTPLRLGQKLGLLPSYVRGSYGVSAQRPADRAPLTGNTARVRRAPSAPRPFRAPDPNQLVLRVPVKTILGIENGVGDCLEIAAKKLRANRPAGWEENPCYQGLGDATTESLKMNLFCCCYLGGYIALRILVAFLTAPVVMVLNLLVGVVLIIPTTLLCYQEVVCKSKCIGPVAKFFIVLGTPILCVLALVTILIWSLCNGFLIPFEYCMAESFSLMIAGPYSFLTNGYTKRKGSFAQYNIDPDLEYWDVRIWAPFAALIGIVFGLAFCVIAFLLIQLLLSPKLMFSLTYQLWSEPMDPSRPKRDDNKDECYQLCMCCYESCLDLCLCMTILFRIVMTFVFFIGLILMIPISVIYGLFEGIVSGAGAWYDPTVIWTGPWSTTTKYYSDILEYAELK